MGLYRFAYLISAFLLAAAEIDDYVMDHESYPMMRKSQEPSYNPDDDWRQADPLNFHDSHATASQRSLNKKRNGGTTIVIEQGGYPQQPYITSSYRGAQPFVNLGYNRVPSTRVASLETRSAPLAVVARPMLISPASQPVCSATSCGPSVSAAPAVVVEREEVTRIVREKTCPTGMDLSPDGMCVGLDICPVAYTCPPNSTPGRDGHSCVMTQRPLIECPPGHSMRGRTCVATDMQPADLTCKDPRYTLDYASNVCIQTVEIPPKCPPGFKMQGNDCVQRVPTQPSCPAGWTLSPATRECVRTMSQPAMMNCPEGAIQEPGTNRCVVVRQDPPRCPPRFTFNAANNICTQAVPRVPVECPYGTTRVGQHCERVERSPAEMTCPPGYELGHDNVCIQEVPVPPTCPQGFVMSSNMPDMCEKCVKEQAVCPPGTKSAGYGNNLRCETEIERPSKECCAPGFELENGKCHRVEVLAPTLTCDGQCFTTTETRVAYACPSGTEFVDDPIRPKCVRKMTSTVCEEVPQSKHRCLEEMQQSESSSQQPSLKGNVCTPVPVQGPICNEIPNIETLPAEPYCPEGGELEGRRCVMREPIQPERVCKVGQLDQTTGQCVRHTYAPIKTECPPGSIRKGTRCVAIEQTPPDMVCPPGSEQGMSGVCLQFRPQISSPPRISRVPAIPRCSIGSVQGRECLQSTRNPCETTCPPGSIDDGRQCLATAELITPPPVEKQVRPSYSCPPGSTLNGRDCITTERVAAEETCPMGTVEDYSTGSCQRIAAPIVTPPRTLTAPAVPVCPDGCTPRGMSCMRSLEVEPMISCPEGFYLDNNQCVKQVEQSALCPQGTTLQGSGCVREVRVPPTIRIVNGCVNEVVRECDTCPVAEVKAQCHQMY